VIATSKNLLRLAVVLCCAHGAVASAVTLGAGRGAVLLGQTLDLSFAVTLEASTGADDTCAAVEVRQGEQRVEPARVRVNVERAARAGDFNVRVRSTVPIDEPYVSVVLRAGCNQSVTRRYDFLTDLPTVAVASPAPSQPTISVPASPSAAAASAPPAASDARPPATPARPAAQVTAAAPTLERDGAPAPAAPAVKAQPAAVGAPRATPGSAAPPRAPVSRPAASAPSAGETSAPARAAAGAPPTAPGSTSSVGSRLQLETPGAGQLGLRSSMALATLPDEAASSKRTEAQNMWRALNATADDVLAEARRQEEVRAQSVALTQKANAQAQEIAALKAQLEQAERERMPTWIWLALAALALLLLAVAGLWWRQRSRAQAGLTGRWYQSSVHVDDVEDVAPTIQSPSYAHSVQPAKSDRVPSRLDEDMFVNEDPSESAMAQLESVARESGAGPLQRGPTAAGAPAALPVPNAAGTSAAVAGSAAATAVGSGGAQSAALAATAATAAGLSASREPVGSAGRRPVALSPDEYLDVEQHADFFMSLGQYDQAIEVLQKHIAQYREATPLAFLDLLNVYHMLSRLDDFNRVRADFNRTFTGLAPEFSAFKGVGRGISDYTTAMGVINAHWGRPGMVRTLEEMLFRRPEHAAGDGFDIEAFRDLILLHQVARSTAVGAGTGADASADAEARRGTPSTWANSLFESDRLPLSGPQIAATAVSAAPIMGMDGSTGSSAMPDDGDLVVTDSDIDVDLSEPVGQDFVATQPPPETARAKGGGAAAAPAAASGLDIDFPDFDFEAPAGPIGAIKTSGVVVDTPLSRPGGLPSSDPVKPSTDKNLVDFDFFDSELEAKLAPKKVDPRS
jgi:pilus assembly protein FimV